MKIRNLLYIGMISLFLGACSSSSTDVDIPTVALDGTLTLKVSVSSIGTRAVDIAVQNGAVSQLKSVDLVFLKGNAGSQKVLSVLHMTSSQIKNLLSAEGLKHFDDRKLITGVVLVSNLPHGVDGIVEGMTVTEVSSYVNRMMFDRIQPGRDIEKEGIKNAPTYGLNEVLIESVDGNYFANIKLKPLISRIQAHRMVAFDDTKVSDLKVTRLFLDNFIEDNKNPEIRFTVGTTAGDALDNLLGKFKTIFEFADSGIVNLDQTIDNKTYAYHVFPQKVKVVSSVPTGVNLVLRLDYWDIELAANKTSYATLRLATASGGKLDNGSVDILEAMLYNIDLGKIDWDGNGIYEPDKDKFKPEFGNETPNAERKTLATIVEIIPWNKENTIPSIH